MHPSLRHWNFVRSLTVVKPVRITHLTVLLHGYVRVYKGPGAQNNEPVRSPAEIKNISSRGERKKYYNGYASLFQDEQVLSSDGRLEPGRYEFNFDLLFPEKGLPSSIDVRTISSEPDSTVVANYYPV